MGNRTSALSLAYVSSIVKNAGWNCKVADLNIKIFKKVSKEDQELYWTIHTKSDEKHDSYLIFHPKSDKEKKVLNFYGFYSKYKDQVEDMILELYDSDDFDLVSFTVNMGTRQFTINATNFLKQKRPDVKILYGGADCFPKEYNKNFFKDGTKVDIICQGDAEIYLPKFLKDIEEKGSIYTNVSGFAYIQNNEIVDTGNTVFPDYNDNLILSDWSQFDFTDYTKPGSFPIFTCRGCINRCKFCNEYINFKKFRYKKG